MNPRECLVLICKNGKWVDKTREITNIAKSPNNLYANISYDTGTYTYKTSNYLYLRNPIKIAINRDNRYFVKGKEIINPTFLDSFNDNGNIWYTIGRDDFSISCKKEELTINEPLTKDTDVNNVLRYLKELASHDTLKIENTESKDQTPILSKYYNSIEPVKKESALAAYIKPIAFNNEEKQEDNDVTIYPFATNLSQMKAIQRALDYKLSTIQGPPGTGKTQTILNLLANLIIRDKTAIVVSNNNHAIQNIKDKLESIDGMNLGFLVAFLGSMDNKTAFINSHNTVIPKLSEWEIAKDEMRLLEERIKYISNELKKVLEIQNLIAKLRQELDETKIEKAYFLNMKENEKDEIDDIITKNAERFPSDSSLITSFEKIKKTNGIGFKSKKWIFSLRYKIKFRLIKNITYEKFISSLETVFYINRISYLESTIKEKERELANLDMDKSNIELVNSSRKYLKAMIAERYKNRDLSTQITDEDLFRQPKKVLKRYPLILSTTYSSTASVNHAFYDYLIMDEASQVGITSGSLALSCAKNAVIIGDLKQLTNIVNNEEINSRIFAKYDIDTRFRYSNDNNFLSSFSSILKEDQTTLLKEHYRCKSKIINFCNQKFYRGQLIMMRFDNSEKNDEVKAICTPKGNFKTSDNINFRQIDEICEHIIPKLIESGVTDIGIIAPYRNQADEIRLRLQNKNIKSETVHKFQGQENKAIIFSTVDDIISNFANSSELINVAVSRAEDQFILLVTGNELNGNIKELYDYISYTTGNISTSSIYSIFDLLYQNREEEIKEIMNKTRNISQYPSEVIAFKMIQELLDGFDENLKLKCHYPLRFLINTKTFPLSNKEVGYIKNRNSHVDFLIYRNTDKTPIAAIEIDGYTYHKKGTKQADRDIMKNAILEKYEIPLLRLNTRGSGEREKITKVLNEYMEKQTTMNKIKPEIN